MDKNKEKVEAYPSIGMISQIVIKGEDKPISIGGFTIDGGFYLRFPYELIKEKGEGLCRENTYYIFVKDKDKMSKHEKEMRDYNKKQAEDGLKDAKERLKYANESIKKYTKELKELEESEKKEEK